MMYDELIKRLREDKSWVEQGLSETEHKISEHIQQAADVIEELTALLRRQEIELAELTREFVIKPRWIPVTERLPEVNERVMVCVKNCGELWVYDATRWNGEHWEAEMEACYDYWKEIDEPVTHWMPLPELPKEENNG